MLNTTHREILNLMPEMRRVVAGVLRFSRYYTPDDIDECMSFVMVQALDYGTRTFDPAKGSARAHFTCFARSRAKNWLVSSHKRFEVPDEHIGPDGEVCSHAEAIPAEGDPFRAMLANRDASRIRAALAALTERERALVEAFVRLGSWVSAADEIGVSRVKAHRMKVAIIERLK